MRMPSGRSRLGRRDLFVVNSWILVCWGGGNTSDSFLSPVLETDSVV